uniref:Uncharacterized protein n=1 Tax=Anopheles melas TaxID=34690 RepID=A0A182U3S3_9DIPT
MNGYRLSTLRPRKYGPTSKCSLYTPAASPGWPSAKKLRNRPSPSVMPVDTFVQDWLAARTYSVTGTSGAGLPRVVSRISVASLIDDDGRGFDGPATAGGTAGDVAHGFATPGSLPPSASLGILIVVAVVMGRRPDRRTAATGRSLSAVIRALRDVWQLRVNEPPLVGADPGDPALDAHLVLQPLAPVQQALEAEDYDCQ